KQALCRACETSVSIRYGTAYLDLHAAPPIFETAVRALAEGNSIRATARIVQVDKDAVCAWLDRAAQHCRLVMLYLWRDLHVIECQLDELWSFVHTKQHHLPFARLYDQTYRHAWLGTRLCPRVAARGGLRDRETDATERRFASRACPARHRCAYSVLHQRSITRVSAGSAACIRHVASTTTPRESRPLSQTTAPATARAVVCPSREDASPWAYRAG